MTAAYDTQNAAAGNAPFFWVEIEGVRDAFGTRALAASYFSGRAATAIKDQCLAYMAQVPDVADQVVDPLNGRSSIGAIGFQLVDVAGAVATLLATNRTSDWLFLKTDLTLGGTTISYHAPAGYADTNFPAVDGIVYINGETFKYAAKDAGLKQFTGCTRAMYGSKAQTHIGRTNQYVGDVISLYPRFIKKRRVDLYMNFVDQNGNTLVDTDKKALPVGGSVLDWSWDKGLESVRFTCGNVQMLTKRPAMHGGVSDGKLVSAFRRWRSRLGIHNGRDKVLDSSGHPRVDYRWNPQAPGNNELILQVIDDDFPADGDWVYLMMDEEIMLVQIDRSTLAGNNAKAKIPAGARSLWGSLQQEHEPGATVQEVHPVIKKSASGPHESSQSAFTVGDHRLEIYLQFLLSKKGDGANHATYDVLPERFGGLGVDPALVDVTGLEALFKNSSNASLANYHYRTVLTEPIKDFREWAAEQLLKPLLAFPYVKMENVLSVVAIRAFRPGDTAVATFDHTNAVAKPVPNSGVSNLVKAIVRRCDWLPAQKKFKTVIVDVVEGVGSEAFTLYADGKVHEVDDRGGHTGVIVFPTNLTDARWFRDRYGKPTPDLVVECSLDQHVREIGDFVTVNFPSTPNAESATRGINSVVYQVLSKRIDLRAGRVTFILNRPPQPDPGGYLTRYWSPACAVTGWTDATKLLAVSAAAYAATGNDTDYFTVGWKVRVYRGDRTSRSAQAEVMAKAAGTVTLDKDAAALGFTPANGDVLLADDYTGQVAAQKLQIASAGAGELPEFSASARAHEWAA